MDVVTTEQTVPAPRRLANALRFLAMDAVEQAKSGHPGMPMGMADIAEVLWRHHLRHNPGDPTWPNRDRFVLSNGHGSMLLYGLLHLTGYDLPLDELKHFRQLHSTTPGHPEHGMTPGIETTTGPLGQGLATAVGMAMAEQQLALAFNRGPHAIVDHRTFVFCGDGCLMEGISHEACSFAGSMKLEKLIVFYDDNGISIDGHVDGWFNDDTPKRFEAYGWRVIRDVDGLDSQSVEAAVAEAITPCGRRASPGPTTRTAPRWVRPRWPRLGRRWVGHTHHSRYPRRSAPPGMRDRPVPRAKPSGRPPSPPTPPHSPPRRRNSGGA
jgi:transketolase